MRSSENKLGVPAQAGAPSSIESYKKYTFRKWVVLFACLLLVFASTVWAVSSGSSGMSAQETVMALFGMGTERTSLVVWNLRMPRILTAIVGGFGLGMAGCAFQAVLRNPLASPSTLGISQGAAFGASVAIILLGAGTATSGAVAADIVSINNP